MAGTPIQTFNDFMNATGPTYLTSADAVINEAVKNTYAFSRLLKEKTSEATAVAGLGPARPCPQPQDSDSAAVG